VGETEYLFAVGAKVDETYAKFCFQFCAIHSLKLFFAVRADRYFLDGIFDFDHFISVVNEVVNKSD